DCIAGFESVLNMQGKDFEGKLLRLDLVDDKIQYVAYSKQEIGIAMENDIETR
ncbi:MAG: hypothetical protein RIS47_658, partial [Bacteroidota bacterium]